MVSALTQKSLSEKRVTVSRRALVYLEKTLRLPYYPSDMSDDEWAVLEPLIPARNSGGRPATHRRRNILDAIFYMKRNGIS